MSTNNDPPQKNNQIFISYAHEDSNYAHRLFKELKEFENEYNLKFWLDKDSLLPGQNWSNVIQNVINESKYFIVLLSKNAIEKNTYVQEELRLALEKADKQQAQIYIIPVRLDNCEIIELIQKLHVVDVFPDWKYGFEKILLAMGISAKPKRLSDIHWENLLEAIDRKNCIPFIGSATLEFFNKIDGDAFLPHDELAKEWAEQYDYPFEAPYQLPKVAQYVVINEIGNEYDVKEYITARFRKMSLPNFSSIRFNKSPHAILAELNLPIYITTNYDSFMEAALKNRNRKPKSEICKWSKQLGEIVDEETQQDPYKPTAEEPLVFHFHGTIDIPQSLVLTERDHSEFVINTNKESEKDMLPIFLRKALPTSTLLFIGYSLDDINFRSIFQGALSFMSSISKHGNSIAVIQTPLENNSVKREKVTKYMEKYTNYMFDIVIYWGELNEFIEELQTKWKKFNENKSSGREINMKGRENYFKDRKPSNLNNIDIKSLEPYIGPRPFNRNLQDQQRFFGRDYETDEIVSLISSHKLVLIYAQSGAGKTSIFNAQVIPTLEQMDYEVLPVIRLKSSSNIIPNIDTQDVNMFIFNSLQSLKPELDPNILKDKSLTEFLHEYFPIKRDNNDNEMSQILIFDQLEEIFDILPRSGKEQRKDFFTKIAQTLTDIIPLQIVFIISEDYIAQLDSYNNILPEKLRPRFRLERLKANSALLALKGPLKNVPKDIIRHYKGDIDKDIKNIVHELRKIRIEYLPGKTQTVDGDFIEPIQLQICAKSWIEKVTNFNNKSSKENITYVSNVDTALEEFYEDTINEVINQGKIKESDIRKWCEENLITQAGTRSIVHISSDYTAGLKNDLIKLLENNYFIKENRRAGSRWCELTHDRLIQPIISSNQKWRNEQRKRKKLKNFFNKRLSGNP